MVTSFPIPLDMVTEGLTEGLTEGQIHLNI